MAAVHLAEHPAIAVTIDRAWNMQTPTAPQSAGMVPEALTQNSQAIPLIALVVRSGRAPSGRVLRWAQMSRVREAISSSPAISPARWT
ncbi:MAG TPA: hypothetical protein VH374_19185 [Polyangia bacterium]|nr:hypothetical protein [Polyangia bacterium]